MAQFETKRFKLSWRWNVAHSTPSRFANSSVYIKKYIPIFILFNVNYLSKAYGIIENWKRSGEIWMGDVRVMALVHSERIFIVI